MKSIGLRAVALAGVLGATFFASNAHAISREEALVRARAYATHRWSSGAANQSASCSAAYSSLFTPGDYVGVSYDWGGYMSLFTFDQQLAAGYGAGSQEPDGILACTSGVDCSGYMSMVWATSHTTTSGIPGVTSVIGKDEMLVGDVFNKAGFHVAMFTHLLASGAPAMIESVGYNVHTNTTGGWSYVNGYTPRRFPELTGTTAGNPVGTTSNPIVISSLPYSDSRNTQNSLSRVLDGCAASPGTQERGPEYVYALTVTQPGTLSVSVADDAASDIDVELLTNLSTAACTTRHDSAFTTTVGCGTYYIVADTFGANSANAGAYTLNVNLAPSGQGCGDVAGPPAFNPKGNLGDACSYPGHEGLGWCNSNLGAEMCLYNESTSWCTRACSNDSECGGMPGGGCCQDIGNGESYCMTNAICGGGSSGGPGSSGDGGSGGSSGEATGEGDPNNPNGTTTRTTSSCAAAPIETTALGFLLVVPIAGLLAVRRRRRI